MRSLTFVLSAACALAAPTEDLVTDLAGYNGVVEGLYSGFLDYQLDDGRSISTHYLFTKQAKDAPPSDRLIFWSNGGPGASSFFGFM